MNDKELEGLLMDEVLELDFNDDVTNNVNPWKHYFEYLVGGLILTTIYVDFIDFWKLVSILGMLFTMLGFRGLKNVNKWYMIGYVFSGVYFLLQLGVKFIECSIWNEVIWSKPFFSDNYILYICMILTVLFYICLWRGTVKVENEAGINTHSISPLLLIVWYLLMSIVSLMQNTGTFITIVLLIGRVAIMVGLLRLCNKINDVGYVIKPSNVRISNKKIVAFLFAISLFVVVVIYMNNKYPMDWKTNEMKYNENQEIIKNHLLELGVSEIIIDDMKAEDLDMCADAVDVIIYEEDLPLNNGKQVTKEMWNGAISTTTEYDIYELHMTGVAVKLDEDGKKWRMIYHFDFNEEVEFKGTESIKITESEIMRENAQINGDISGCVIYVKDSEKYVAEYYNIEYKNDICSMFGLSFPLYEIVASFSFDEKADDYRGYVSYEIEKTTNKDVLDPEIKFEYYHQNKILTYPAVTSEKIAFENKIIPLDNRNFKKTLLAVRREEQKK